MTFDIYIHKYSPDKERIAITYHNSDKIILDKFDDENDFSNASDNRMSSIQSVKGYFRENITRVHENITHGELISLYPELLIGNHYELG